MGEGISIRFAGKGGQGIIFSGIALARAFSLYENGHGKEYYAYQTQSYGPEARGGASKCDIRVTNDESSYPFVEKPDFLVLMSQDAFDKYIEDTKPGTLVILDKGQIKGYTDLMHYIIPATEKAEELGAKIVANVIMLGAFVEISGIITKKAIYEALGDISPHGTKEMNKKAFRLGSALAKQVLAKKFESGKNREE
ncbi:MAG: 2-oxoacid:ferredoxin oxidoreductase subunit gamma [Methanomassiliicoccales archaeon]|nr:2-oxoacid:ferredoxin oxidoreductase subunit gamma [Methanomassiliicoccales archaeon]NYT15168.1 2-oxoacid:ferredoxin oxidoreductase subunit gamma [Methanomassiliicoccales archaeon]